jgi:Ribbon-helix-helix protein, copG family.
MNLSVRLSPEDGQIIKKYAEINNMSISDLVRQSVLEKIEDDFDLTSYQVAMTAHTQNPITYTLDEVEKELDLR